MAFTVIAYGITVLLKISLIWGTSPCEQLLSVVGELSQANE